jgi:hypothetical protein
MGKRNDPEIFFVLDEDDRVGKPFNKNSPGTN